MSDEPLISVVVPVRNGEDLIGACIESLLAMDYPQEKVEIIIVDNNSTDGTHAVIHRYPVIAASERRPGVSAARNTGIMTARGKIVAFTDADCVVDSRWAQEIEKTFRDRRVDVVMGFAGGINANMFAELVQKRWEDAWFQKSATGYSLKRKGIDTRNCALRKSVLHECGYFDPQMLHCGDLELSVRLNRAGCMIVLNPTMKVWHKNPTSFSVVLEKSRIRMPFVLRFIRSLPEGVSPENVPYPSSAFHGIANYNMRGITLTCVLLFLRLLRRLVLSGFQLCLALRIRHPLTLKLYKVFFGLSYDIAILRTRRERQQG